jgi:hypothetical protein
MSMTTKWFAVLTALNLVFGIAQAQDVSGGVDVGGEVTVEPDRVQPERPEKPERPERPEKAGISQEMKELVTEFRSKVAEFHSEQKELIKKLKNATEEEREEIREQLKANRDELKQIKEGFRDSVKDLTGTLKDHAAKVSAEAKAEARHGRSRD